MNINELKKLWLPEEKSAHIHGWDFSHLDGRFNGNEDDLPWDYKQLVLEHISPDMRLLDIDTGGGEFLLSLGHPHSMTSATEGFPPNVELCRKKLTPLGIDFHEWHEGMKMPFSDDSFDIIINRHRSCDIPEIWRILKKGGIFITQQVGGENDRELAEMLCPDRKYQYSDHCLENELRKFITQGFTIADSGECVRPIEFYDTGALVWFARVIPWEFPDFSVENNFEMLLTVQDIIETQGRISGHTHRFMITAIK